MQSLPPRPADLTRRAFVVTTAALALLGLPGCATKNGKGKKSKPPSTPTAEAVDAFGKVKKRIKKHVADKGRRKAASELVDEAKRNIVDINKYLDDLRSDLVMLPTEQRRDRAAWEPISKKYNDKMVESLRFAAQNAVDMRKHITAEEWRLIFPPPKGA